MKRKKKQKISIPLSLLLSGAALVLLVIFLYPIISKKVKPRCANSISCEESMKLKIENDAVGIFNNKPVTVPPIELSQQDNENSVLGTSKSSGEKHIYVDLATQMLSAYEGDKLFMFTSISSGLWGRTPKGEFTIWIKLRSTRMTGGSGDDYYDLPNVPYVMFFSNNEVPASRGFSLHGTYWHNNFGHPMSHGCVNMKTTDIAKLYEWADPPTQGHTTHANTEYPGTKITIYDSSEMGLQN